MTLVLQIENYDVLDDGGPASITLHGAGCHVGRSGAMDWVLPDPSRHISGHHFEIIFRDGAYWLSDLSTNGTYLKGQRYRIEGAHRLAHNDRFQVGPYAIVALLDAPGQAPTPDGQSWGGAGSFADDGDPWAIGGGPVNPIDPLPRTPQGRQADFGGDFIANPVPGAPMPTPEPPPPAAPPVPERDDQPASGSPFDDDNAAPLQSAPMPRVTPRPPGPATRPPVVPAPRTDPAGTASPAPQTPTGTAQSDAFVRAFCEGAGLPPEAYADIDADDLARSLGQSLQIVTAEVMSLLQARASAKEFTRAGARTMRGATDNNPLKFMPDTAQALEAMYLKPRAGFQKGPEGLQESLGDVRLHQMAVFAAIQPALAQLLDGIAPEEIETTAGKGSVLGGGKRARQWEMFVERWDQKASAHDNGMLDEFLSHFARAYADVVRKS